MAGVLFLDELDEFPAAVRTLADLDDSDDIEESHAQEALGMRTEAPQLPDGLR